MASKEELVAAIAEALATNNATNNEQIASVVVSKLGPVAKLTPEGIAAAFQDAFTEAKPDGDQPAASEETVFEHVSHCPTCRAKTLDIVTAEEAKAIASKHGLLTPPPLKIRIPEVGDAKA